MRALDLFCGAGGASMGLSRAGFDVTGVDLHPQPNYPFRFIQADALTVNLDGYDLIWASPPCQAHTTMSNRWRGKGGLADQWLNLIPNVRERLLESGAPYVMENVPGAVGWFDRPVTLTGEMFGLGVHRPRIFEVTFPVSPPPKPLPSRNSIGVYGKRPDGRLLWRRADGSEQRAAKSLVQGQAAMGIDWMQWRELAEAIPPAYSEFLARALVTAQRTPC